jgi:hypothetical protein
MGGSTAGVPLLTRKSEKTRGKTYGRSVKILMRIQLQQDEEGKVET